MMKSFEISSRYGQPRQITDNGHNVFTMSGEARWCRFGMSEDNSYLEYIDFPGGPFIKVGYDYGFGKILTITPEDTEEGKFKVRFEVE